MSWFKRDKVDETKDFDPNQPTEQVEQEEEQEFDSKAAYRKLEERFTQEFDRQRQKDERFLQALERLGSREQPKEPVQAKEIDWNDLPDAVTEPEKFNAAIKDKLKKATEATQQADKQRRDDEERNSREERRVQAELNDVWESFQTEYPDLASKPRVLKGVVADLIEKGVERGLSKEQVILNDPEAFKAKVVSLASEELGVSPDQFRGQKKPNRTMGIQGGQAKTGTGPKTPQKSTFFAELREEQGKKGLYHVN